MVKVRYTGVTSAEKEFSALREAHRHLRAMQARCRPFDPDYLVLGAVLDALSKAAAHFTKDPYFYGGRPH